MRYEQMTAEVHNDYYGGLKSIQGTAENIQRQIHESDSLMSCCMYFRFLSLSLMKMPSAPADVHDRKLQWSWVPAYVYLLALCRGTHVASFHSLKGAVLSISEEDRTFYSYSLDNV